MSTAARPSRGPRSGRRLVSVVPKDYVPTKRPRERTTAQRNAVTRGNQQRKTLTHRASLNTAAIQQRAQLSAQARQERQAVVQANRQAQAQSDLADRMRSRTNARRSLAIQAVPQPSGNVTPQSGIGAGILKMFAVIFGLAILYLFVSKNGSNGTKFIGAAGNVLTGITSGKIIYAK